MNNFKKEVISINSKEVEVYVDYDKKDIYMSQNEIVELYGVSRYALLRLLNKNKEASTCADSAQVQQTFTNIGKVQIEGNKEVTRNVKHYNLSVIKEVGYKLNYDLTNEFLHIIDELFEHTSNYQLTNYSLSRAINYEIVKYKDGEISIDVNVSPTEETIWLAQDQISVLFDRDTSVISRHIKNILDEGECNLSNLQKMQFTTSNKPVILYDLEMIISIGYRVNSKRGTLFRRWANSILKDYIIKGYSINRNRCLECNSSVISLQNEMNLLKGRVDILEDISFVNNDVRFSSNEILEAYGLIRKIIFIAKKKLIIIDPYADNFLLTMLENVKVNITIYTSNMSLIKDYKLNSNIEIIVKDNIHSRIIISDDSIFSITHSFNGLGKSEIIISRLKDIKTEDII